MFSGLIKLDDKFRFKGHISVFSLSNYKKIDKKIGAYFRD